MAFQTEGKTVNDEDLTEEEIEIEEETDKWETIEEKPQTTEIEVEDPKDKTDKGKCPYCGGSNIGKDPKKNVYVCFTCKKTYVWEP